MILDELQTITSQELSRNRMNAFIRMRLEEYLQVYILNFIYTNPRYSNSLIFTGGTCLRHCFGLNRLSEDLDFDLLGRDAFDIQQCKKILEDYFMKEHLYKAIQITTKQQGKQLLLKFPVLHELNLAAPNESDLLYVKIDFAINDSQDYQTFTTLKSMYDFNYIVKHYDLPTLMASKIVAILTRELFWGKEDKEIIKGRDYFDLLWFLEGKVIPRVKRINDLLKTTLTLAQIKNMLDEKVEIAVTKKRADFKRDILPFIDNYQIIDDYIEGFLQNYRAKSEYLLLLYP